MLSALLLSAALTGQLPNATAAQQANPARTPAPAAKAAPKAAEKPRANAPEKPKASAFKPNPTLESTIRRKQELAARKKTDRIKAAERKRREAEQWQLYVERVGPVIAAQQREQWQRNMQAAQLRQQQQQLQIEADKAASLRRLSEAAELDAYQNMLKQNPPRPR